MTKCKSCGVWVDGALGHCPLCHRRFAIETDAIVNEWYPAYELDKQDLNNRKYKPLIVKATLFTAIILCSNVAFINAFAINDRIWCHLLIIPIIYVAFTIIHTLCSRAHIGMKILLQSVAIAGLLLTVDIQSGFTRWSLNYALPVLIIISTISIAAIMGTKKIYLGEMVEFMVALVLLSLLPVHLYLFGITDVFWPATVAEACAMLTLIGFFFFLRKDFTSEIKKRFHF